MNRQKSNWLSLALSLLLSCAFIPSGVTKGWSVIEFVVVMASILICGLVVSWNNEFAFRKSPSENHVQLWLFLAFLLMISGIQGLLGSWGDGLLLKGIGSALTISGAVILRLAPLRGRGE